MEGFSTSPKISVTLLSTDFPGDITPYEDTSFLSTSIIASMLPEL